jgi:peptidyl-tRNA hydrolase
MGKITTIQNKEFGEIRIGVDDDTPEEAWVTLALNHWEDDEKWGGQPLSPKLAAYLGTLLIEYAAKAEEIRQRTLKKIAPF